jgi:hypothetical protein
MKTLKKNTSPYSLKAKKAISVKKKTRAYTKRAPPTYEHFLDALVELLVPSVGAYSDAIGRTELALLIKRAMLKTHGHS